jgi:hypothetical protein
MSLTVDLDTDTDTDTTFDVAAGLGHSDCVSVDVHTVEMSQNKPRRVKRATITHDRETWTAIVGETLSGKDDKGNPISSSATVISLHPGQNLMITDGKGGQWHDRAQVHDMVAVEYFEDEPDPVAVEDPTEPAELRCRAEDCDEVLVRKVIYGNAIGRRGRRRTVVWACPQPYIGHGPRPEDLPPTT